MLEREIDASLKSLIVNIQESDVYKEYHRQLTRLKEYPDFYQKVNEFRQKNYELQNAGLEEDLFERMEAFNQENEALRAHPLVDDFLEAELAFCRMIQEINLKIMEALDFE